MLRWQTRGKSLIVFKLLRYLVKEKSLEIFQKKLILIYKGNHKYYYILCFNLPYHRLI